MNPGSNVPCALASGSRHPAGCCPDAQIEKPSLTCRRSDAMWRFPFRPWWFARVTRCSAGHRFAQLVVQGDEVGFGVDVAHLEPVTASRDGVLAHHPPGPGG